MRSARSSSRRRTDAGYVVITTALVLVVLCGFAALAVDMSLLLAGRTAAQRAADAGAMAGAFSFVSNQLAPQPETALAHARAVATANKVLDSAVAGGEVTVTVDVGGRLVTVDVRRSIPTFFARVLGRDSVAVLGHAVAEASPWATAAYCAKPWFLPNTALSTLAPCDACVAGEVLILPGGGVNPWAQARLGALLPIRPCNPADALAPGQFYSVAMGDSRGGEDYRTNIATCASEILRCAASYAVEPGAMIGPTAHGVAELIGPNPDVFRAIGRYERADGTVSDTSHQLVSVPVWDTCTPYFCPAGELPDGGRGVTIQVIGFAQVFVEGLAGSAVRARITGVSSCGSGGIGGIGPDEIGPYAVPVRLVRTE